MLADQLPTQFLRPGLDLRMVVQYQNVSVSTEKGDAHIVVDKTKPDAGTHPPRTG